MNTDENQKLWIQKIHDNLILRGRSINTFFNYKCALNKFFNYYNSKTVIASLNEDDILPYINECFIKMNKSNFTYNVSIVSIRLLYLVCFNRNLSRIFLPTSKITKRLPAFLPKNIFIKIFNDEKVLKHKCWLILAFCCGLRVNEVANIKVENIYSKEHKLRVLGKGNKERFTILPDIVIKFLRLYCKQKKVISGYLFPGTNNKQVMNPKTIINYFSVLKDTYNLDDRISFHSLRHSFATYYLSNGGSLLALQSMLGHKSLNTTTIYLHLSQNFNQLKGINYAK